MGILHSNQEKRAFLASRIYTRQEMKCFLDADSPQHGHGHFDAELGWLLRDGRFKDGIDGSISTYRYDALGAREMHNYSEKPCRINTYGDSMTMCAQTSDGETWQEMLAAHLCEPVRNFGVGSFSVYQAYLRMVREEARVPAESIIFTIHDDDHYRNLDAWQGIRHEKAAHSMLYGAQVWVTGPSTAVDRNLERFLERPNPCPQAQDLFNLCDLDWVFERFKDVFVLEVMLAHAKAKEANVLRPDQKILDKTITHGVLTDLDFAQGHSQETHARHTRAALAASIYVTGKVQDFARKEGKKVLYVLSPTAHWIERTIKTNSRWDQPFLDFLVKNRLPHVDLVEAHLQDFAQFKVPLSQYLARYFIGHYNPFGNLFMAHCIKSKLVEMLEPRPTAYLGGHAVGRIA